MPFVHRFQSHDSDLPDCFEKDGDVYILFCADVLRSLKDFRAADIFAITSFHTQEIQIEVV